MTKVLTSCRYGAVALMLAGLPAHAGLLTFEEFTDPAILANELGPDGRLIRSGKITRLVGTIDGVTLDIYRRNNQPFDIANNNLQRPKASPGDETRNGVWGDQSLDPFVTVLNQTTYPTGYGLIISFSQPQKIVSALLGDYGGDTDIINFRAFSTIDASGNALDTVQTTMAPGAVSNAWTEKRVTVQAEAHENIRSVEILAGFGQYPNNGFLDLLSVFVDRVFYTDEMLLPGQTLEQLFAANGVTDEDYDGNSLLPPPPTPNPVPEPASIILTLAIGAGLRFRR